jgi:hypothetical protein
MPIILEGIAAWHTFQLQERRCVLEETGSVSDRIFQEIFWSACFHLARTLRVEVENFETVMLVVLELLSLFYHTIHLEQSKWLHVLSVLLLLLLLLLLRKEGVLFV